MALNPNNSESGKESQLLLSPIPKKEKGCGDADVPTVHLGYSRQKKGMIHSRSLPEFPESLQSLILLGGLFF